MTLTEYLFKVIEKFDVKYTFGIPGDFALPLYAAQENSNIKGIVCTHEPNAVFAADAYARVTGLGVVLTTYGAGALNMINPVAMAYAEKSPIVVISGAPEQEMMLQNKSVHHLVRDYQTQIRIFSEICVKCLSVQNTETAAEQILDVFQTAIKEQQPVYIEIPRNLMGAEIEGTNCLEKNRKPERLSDAECLDEACLEIANMIKRKKSPVILAGVGVRRYRLKEALEKWSEKCSIPVVTSVMGKGAFSETHPNFRGVFMGDMGSTQAKELISQSDCVLQLGVIQSDVNTGFWTGVVEKSRSIEIQPHHLRVSQHHYKDVHMVDLVEKLANESENCGRTLAQLPKIRVSESTALKENLLSPTRISEILNDLNLNRYHVLCDIGDAWFIGLELKANSFMAPGYYASMGFAVPGALGAGLGQPTKRNLVIVGDGAFQMTGNEISSLQKHNIPTTVLLINNKSYKMLETFDQPREYFDLYNWDYVRFSQALNCFGVQVNSCEELEAELLLAERRDGVTLIEAVVGKEKHPPIMEKIRKFISQSVFESSH